MSVGTSNPCVVQQPMVFMSSLSFLPYMCVFWFPLSLITKLSLLYYFQSLTLISFFLFIMYSPQPKNLIKIPVIG